MGNEECPYCQGEAIHDEIWGCSKRDAFIREEMQRFQQEWNEYFRELLIKWNRK